MSIDFKKALKAPASIDGWGLKLFIGGLINLVPILNFATMGYWVEYLINFMNGKEELPGGVSDNLNTNFITGAKMIVGCIILGIIFLLITFVVSIVLAKLKFLALIIVTLLELVMMFATLFLVMGFAVDKKILSMLDFNRAIQITKDNPYTLNYILYTLLLIIIYSAIMLVVGFTGVGLVLLPFLSFAMGISMYNLMGQYIQSSPHLAELRTPNNQ